MDQLLAALLDDLAGAPAHLAVFAELLEVDAVERVGHFAIELIALVAGHVRGSPKDVPRSGPTILGLDSRAANSPGDEVREPRHPMADSTEIEKLEVSVLGATGLVGQRFVERLAEHPSFQIAHLAASPSSVGKSYGEACAWRAGGTPHGGLAGRELVPCDPGAAGAPLVFSALDTDVAREVEPAFARAGCAVFSNASAFRMEPDVPLLVPEVNGVHLALLQRQRRAREWSGALVCNPNCTAAVLVVALEPLRAAFGIEAVACTSLQAVSGAGVAGLGNEGFAANVIPFIPGEEEKLARETARILGRLAGEDETLHVEPRAFPVSAACHRVPVRDGHTLSVAVRLGGSPTPEEVREVLASFRSPELEGLPTAPPRPIVVHDEPDRPQPRLDAEWDGGMPVHVGRVRTCPVLGIRFVVMGHNLERGAAGGSVLNAELYERLG